MVAVKMTASTVIQISKSLTVKGIKGLYLSYRI